MITAGFDRGAPPRSRRRRSCSGTASGPRTRPHRCRRSCRPAEPRAPSGPRGPRSRPGCRSWAICASEMPCRLASRSTSAVSSGASCDDLGATSVIKNSWSTNHGSILVASCTCSALAPARIACTARPSRPSCGRARLGQQLGDGRLVDLAGQVERRPRILQAAQRLAQRLGEVAADGHRLADALHVSGQCAVGRGELLEREPRHLDHDVVQGRFEAGRGSVPRGRPCSPFGVVMSLGISSRV